MNPGRWAMALAKRHRAALAASGEASPPAMIDVTVSLLIAQRKAGIDLTGLMELADRDLIAEVGMIHERIDRKTGELRDLFAPTTEGVKP
jgi:hypothetical protein